jgi:hypothetical protein
VPAAIPQAAKIVTATWRLFDQMARELARHARRVRLASCRARVAAAAILRIPAGV